MDRTQHQEIGYTLCIQIFQICSISNHLRRTLLDLNYHRIWQPS